MEASTPLVCAEFERRQTTVPDGGYVLLRM